jgi:hypothetical protein
MSLSQQEARPPYVSFVAKAEEDREATIKAGQAVMKDVHYALVTPHGSKDRLERRVDEWFPQLDEAVKQERMLPTWVKAYKEAYKAWEEGRDIPETGTSVRNWPLLTPAQVENLLLLKVRTVEDLAAANEELIRRLGMGGRTLKDKAKAWLDTAGSDGSKLAERMTALEVSSRQLTETNADLLKRNTELQAQIAALSPKATKATATA